MEENNNMQVEKQTINQKNNSVSVIVLMLLVIALAGALIYVLVLKPKDETKPVDNNGGTQTTNVLSNDEALRIAKEKIETANNFFGAFDSMHCDDSNIKDDLYCYYGLKSKLEEDFYKIYSRKLELNDVFAQYDLTTKEIFTNFVLGDLFINSYAIQEDEVWVDNSCRASGEHKELIDFKIDKVTNEIIEANYAIRLTWEDELLIESLGGNKSETEIRKQYEDISKLDREKVVLVKEDDAWKISRATLLDNCGRSYKIGK